MSAVPTVDAKGGCLCGGVRYTVTGPLRPVAYCHCRECRVTSGHFVAATACAPSDLELVASATLDWYRLSERSERGFCRRCGSNLFWRPQHGKHISIMAGTLDVPTGLHAVDHIFMDEKSDYYMISDGLPQYARFQAGADT